MFNLTGLLVSLYTYKASPFVFYIVFVSLKCVCVYIYTSCCTSSTSSVLYLLRATWCHLGRFSGDHKNLRGRRGELTMEREDDELGVEFPSWARLVWYSFLKLDSIHYDLIDYWPSCFLYHLVLNYTSPLT